MSGEVLDMMIRKVEDELVVVNERVEGSKEVWGKGGKEEGGSVK